MPALTISTVYLISGANRGIGFGLTEVLAKRPGTVVFAGARDPTNATALNALAEKYPHSVHVLKLTSGSTEDNKSAVVEIEKTVGQLDVVIANAATGGYYGSLLTTPGEEFLNHFNINTLGPVTLFQAVHSLLIKSPSGAPHFCVISSAVGSTELGLSFGAAAYSASKAAVNHLTKIIHTEHEADGIIATAIHPGWVATDMGNFGASSLGMTEAPVTLAESVAGILSHIDGATRSEKSGKFWNFARTSGNFWDINESVLPW